jgi:hypothetical protein
MAAEEAGGPTDHERKESLIDDLIRDILDDAGPSTKARARGGDYVTTLVEKAIESMPNAAPQASTVEKLLLAQVLAGALADALAPALAELLAPEIMKALEQFGPGDRAGRATTASAPGRAKGNRRRT